MRRRKLELIDGTDGIRPWAKLRAMAAMALQRKRF